VGVDVGPSVIRAAVFSGAFEVLGKMKLSSKPERGFASTIGRIERCIRYAADESNLSLDHIDVVGVGVPGDVDPAGRVTLNHGFDFKDVPLRQQLTARLGCPVHVGNIFDLACHAIQVLESSHESGNFGVLFPGSILAAGLVVDGQSVDLTKYPAGRPLLPAGCASVLEWTNSTKFRAFRARDFRKAIRKGEADAQAFLRHSVVAAAEFGARLVQAAGLHQLVLAGGAVDENKSEMIATAKSTLASLLKSEVAESINVTTSELGDDSGLTGAALVAAQTCCANHDSTNASEEAPRRAEMAR